MVEPSAPKGPLILEDIKKSSIKLSWGPPENLGGADQLTCYVIEARKLNCTDILK